MHWSILLKVADTVLTALVIESSIFCLPHALALVSCLVYSLYLITDLTYCS
jgi:hypothetical protein